MMSVTATGASTDGPEFGGREPASDTDAFGGPA